MLGHISRTLRRPRDSHVAVMPARMPPRLNPRPALSFAVRGGATRFPNGQVHIGCSTTFLRVLAPVSPSARDVAA